MLDVFFRHMVYDDLRRVSMLAFGRIIFRPRPVFDGGDNAGDGHVETREQQQRQREQQYDHRADTADNKLQKLRQ